MEIIQHLIGIVIKGYVVIMAILCIGMAVICGILTYIDRRDHPFAKEPEEEVERRRHERRRRRN